MTSTEQLLRDTFQARAGDVEAGTDLASRVVVAHRAQRHQRLSLVGAAAALIVLVVGVVVPLQTSRDADRGVTGLPTGQSVGYPFPPRGSLADDPAFLEALLRQPWVTGLEPGMDTRQVVFAGDVPGGRWAWVLGRQDGLLVGAWFTGEPTAGAAELSVTEAGRVDLQRAESFADFTGGPGPAVLIGRPGDAFEISDRPEVDAQGTVSRTYRPLATESGVAVAEVPDGGPATTYRVVRDGETVYATSIHGGSVREVTPRSLFVEASRDALGAPDAILFDNAFSALLDRTGLPWSAFDVSVSWGGSADFGGILISAVMPSGAVAVVGECGLPDVSELGLLEVYPVDTEPQDLLIVMHCPEVAASSPELGDYLVLLGPVGTASFTLTDNGEPLTATGGDRFVYFSDPEGDLADLAGFTAIDSDGDVLAAAAVGTVEDLGP